VLISGPPPLEYGGSLERSLFNMSDEITSPANESTLIKRSLPEGELWIQVQVGDCVLEEEIAQWCEWARPALRKSVPGAPLVVSVSKFRVHGAEAFDHV
jgi:hypothetical protein